MHYSHINNNKGVRLPDKKLISFRAQLGMPLCNQLGPLAQAVSFMESRDEPLSGEAAGPALSPQILTLNLVQKRLSADPRQENFF